MMHERAKKRFISFEGIDFSGKSTQIELLKKALLKDGHKVFVLREPGGAEISEKIRGILLDKNHNAMDARTELLLFSAARAQLCAEKVLPLLEQDYFVVADRFVDSTTAYQGYGRGLELELVNHVNHFATFDILPARTFYLRLTVQQAFARRNARSEPTDRLEQAGENFYQKVVLGYDTLAKQNKARFCVIDATQDQSDIHREILNEIQSI